jgi:hypothetical protein
MKTLLLLCAMLSAAPARADFSGLWKGTAVLTLRSGATVFCDDISLDIRQAADRFEFGTFRYACSAYGFSFKPPVLSIESTGRVLWKGQPVGAVDARSVRLLFTLANNGRARYTAGLTPDGDLDYLDEQIDVDPASGAERVTSIKARLVRHPKLPPLAESLSAPGAVGRVFNAVAR